MSDLGHILLACQPFSVRCFPCMEASVRSFLVSTCCVSFYPMSSDRKSNVKMNYRVSFLGGGRMGGGKGV